MKIRLIAAISLLVLVTVSIWAQRGSQNAGAPAAAPMITASEVQAMIAKQPADKNTVGQQMLKLGPYNINMEHRVMGQAASVDVLIPIPILTLSSRSFHLARPR